MDLPNFANSRSYIANSNNSAAPTHLHTQILPLPVQSTTFSYDFNRLVRLFKSLIYLIYLLRNLKIENFIMYENLKIIKNTKIKIWLRSII